MPGLSLLNADSVSLVTSPFAESVQYHLLQLNPDMVPLFEANCQEIGRGTKRGRASDTYEDDEDERASRLCIKGRHSDEAYLCTATQTFALREMTQSNSLLLCTLKDSESLSSPKCNAQIRSNVAEIWELTPVVARTARIAQLLQDSMYFGEDEEEDMTCSKRKKYTPQQVASIVQASTKELQEGIDQSCVIVIDGYSRMIAPTYLMQVLQTLLNHIDLCGHHYGRIPVSTTVSSLQEKHGMRREIIQAILLTWFGKVKEEEKQYSTERTVEIKIDTIIRFIGIQLLESRAKTKADRLEEFMIEWEMAVGPNLIDGINVEMLKGHYLTYPAPPTLPSDTNPALIQHFDASDLPLDPSIRLQRLFQKREQWTLEDLSPFLNEIAIDSKKRDSILLKYARSTTVKVSIPETKSERKARLKKGILQCPTKNVQMYSARLRHN